LLIECEDRHVLFFVLFRVLEERAVFAQEVGLDLFEGGIEDDLLQGGNNIVKVNVFR
jgi:hypothetical protein